MTVALIAALRFPWPQIAWVRSAIDHLAAEIAVSQVGDDAVVGRAFAILMRFDLDTAHPNSFGFEAFDEIAAGKITGPKNQRCSHRDSCLLEPDSKAPAAVLDSYGALWHRIPAGSARRRENRLAAPVQT
ncbi:MAG: hypothetical protein WA459_06120, partial [Stellaceae bacterium]